MSIQVSTIEEALEILIKSNVPWATVNRIQNSLWDKGIAFFGRNHCLVAYYNEEQNNLSFN